MDIQRFEIENITKSGFACVRDILTDRLLVTSDSCDLLNEQYQKILDLQKQLKQQEQKNKKLIDDVLSNIKEKVLSHFNVNTEVEYQKLAVIDALFTADTVFEILDQIQKEFNNGE